MNIAGEKDESGDNRTYPHTYDGSQSDRLMFIEEAEEENDYRQEHDTGQDLRRRWNQAESARRCHTVCPSVPDSSPMSLRK